MSEGAVSYNPTAPADWSKPSPADFGSPHWYTADAFAGLVLAHAAEPEPMPVGAFVRHFIGLSSTVAAKEIVRCFAVDCQTVADLAAHRPLLPGLLWAMKDRARPVKPTALGAVGEDHFRTMVDNGYRIDGLHWYKRTGVVLDGAPWLVEAFLAETETGGGVFHLVNHSPVREDPLARTVLRAGTVIGWGIGGYLEAAEVDVGQIHTAVVHLICPAPTFLDRGKATLDVPDDVSSAVAEALWRVAKATYRASKKAHHEAAHERRRAQRREADKPARTTLRDAVFAVMQEGFDKASGGLPTDKRSVYYVVRDLIQRHTEAELKGSYFDRLIVQWQHENGPLDGLYYDPRGHLHEPHTGTVVPLGTREVADYDAPKWLFDKLLYVEKEGLWPKFAAAQLAERFDMAVMAGKGYAVEAARLLAARVQEHHAFRVFVLHDADPFGYEITRTFSEATERMPDHDIEIVDLGLSVGDAVRLGLGTEGFTREAALSAGLRPRLDDLELEWFTGTRILGPGKPRWSCLRVELNAFTTPDLIAYVEAGLRANGADTKVTPPDAVLTASAERLRRLHIEERVDQLIAQAIDRDAIIETLLGEFADEPLEGLRRDVDTLYEAHRELRWVDALARRVGRDFEPDDAAISERGRELIAEQLTDEPRE